MRVGLSVGLRVGLSVGLSGGVSVGVSGGLRVGLSVGLSVGVGARVREPIWAGLLVASSAGAREGTGYRAGARENNQSAQELPTIATRSLEEPHVPCTLEESRHRLTGQPRRLAALSLPRPCSTDPAPWTLLPLGLIRRRPTLRPH